MNECHALGEGRTPMVFGVLSWAEQLAEELWPIKPVTRLALTERLCRMIVDPASTNREVVAAGRLLEAASRINVQILQMLQKAEAPQGERKEVVAHGATVPQSSKPGVQPQAATTDGNGPRATGGGSAKAEVPQRAKVAGTDRDAPVADAVSYSVLPGVSAARGFGEDSGQAGIDFERLLNPAYAWRPADRESDLLGVPRMPAARRKGRKA